MTLKRIFSNPWFVAIASVCSIASVFEGVFIYRMQTETRSIAASVNPVPTVVVKSGEASQLNISYDGKPILSDITTVQIAVWNSGSKSIRPDNVLRPFVIRTSNRERILEATLRKQSRDVCGAVLKVDKISNGEVEVSWKILEPKDGVLLQVVYEGKPGAQFVASSVIEQQGEITKTLVPRTAEEDRRRLLTVPLYSFTGAMFGTVLMLVKESIANEWRRNRTTLKLKLLAFLFASIVVVAIVVTYKAWQVLTSMSPFGF